MLLQNKKFLSTLYQISLLSLGTKLTLEQIRWNKNKMLKRNQKILLFKLLILLLNHLLQFSKFRLYRSQWHKQERPLKENKDTIVKPLIHQVTRNSYHSDQSIFKDLSLDLPSLLILSWSTSTQIKSQSNVNTNSLWSLKLSFPHFNVK